MPSLMQYEYVDSAGQEVFNYQFIIGDKNGRSQYVLLIKELGE